MLRGSKEILLMGISDRGLQEKIKGYKSDDLVADVFTFAAYKSRKQNNLFHSLLKIFWDSGCSSFETYKELRDYYKELIGLIYTKEAEAGGIRIIERIEKSWSDVLKEDATRTIKQLMYDMDTSDVLGSSKGDAYQGVLRQLGQWFDGIM